MVEVLFAMSILAVALLGLAAAIPVAIQANSRNRVDVQATMLAQREIEQFITQPVSAAAFTDANGNSVTLSAGGAPLIGGKIDFTQNTVTGYSATILGSNGASFDLRWNIQTMNDGSKVFVLGARRVGTQKFLLPAVNLTTRMGKLS